MRRGPRSTSTSCWRSASAPPRQPDRQALDATALIAAAGTGERLGAGGPKALTDLAGRPLVAWCVRAFAAARSVGRAVVAAPPGHEAEIAAAVRGPLEVEVVSGGASRSESVAAALARSRTELVAVHDAARPLVEPDLIDALVARLGSSRGVAGVIAATPVTDTVKRAGPGPERAIRGTENREGLWAAQTPQVFYAGALSAAHASDARQLETATDDAMLVEATGGRVLIEPAPALNLKVTTLADLRLAEILLRERDQA